MFPSGNKAVRHYRHDSEYAADLRCHAGKGCSLAWFTIEASPDSSPDGLVTCT